MAEEIETAAELIDLAELREVVIHEVAAGREAVADAQAGGLPPEELHAPGVPEEFAELDFTTRLEDDRLCVRCRVRTRNAHASFQVYAEAIFSLPKPISIGHPDIIGHFLEQVGAPAVFPYIRAAVAALAAQLSVPAWPLPLLRPGDIALGVEEDPPGQEVVDEAAMRGIVEITKDDGSVEQVLEFFHDAETGEVVRLGSEDVPAEVHQLLDSFAEIGPLEEMTWESVIRTHGEDYARELAEVVRATEGEDAADAATAEIGRIVNELAVEGAATRLHEALVALRTTLASAKKAIAGTEPASGGAERDAVMALVTAAEKVAGRADELQKAGTAGEP
ncbi:MAG: hypothetical protein K0U78_10520 [Actinomycetia bacterium]|nr:hypothetical protein [Actinomycetes bacterium]MCH9734972.1 hypothetical protein [Actinomycetes bacterium]